MKNGIRKYHSIFHGLLRSAVIGFCRKAVKDRTLFIVQHYLERDANYVLRFFVHPHFSLLHMSEILQTNVIDNRSEEGSQVQMNCRWRVLCWFVAFTIRFRKQNRKSGDDGLSDVSINEDSASSETHSVASFDDRSTHFENLFFTADIVRSVLYSTKDNILCLHEVFRQVCFIRCQMLNASIINFLSN